jgi:polar amino acid transport system substrate-binding protein
MNAQRLVCYLMLAGFVLMAHPVWGGEGNLTYITEEAPPQNYRENGELKGLAVDLLKEMWKKMGMTPKKIQVLPWSEGYDRTLNTPDTVLFSMTRLEEREQLFKWVGPIRTPRFIFLGKSKDHISLVSINDARKYRIGTVKDDASELLILSRNVVNRDALNRSPDLKTAIERLRAGKVDIVAYGEESVWSYIKLHKLNNLNFAKVFTISGASDFYAFHKDTPDAVIKNFQNALNAVKRDKVYTEILNRYRLVD